MEPGGIYTEIQLTSWCAPWGVDSGGKVEWPGVSGRGMGVLKALEAVWVRACLSLWITGALCHSSWD